MLVELCFGTLLFLICFFWGFTALNGVVFQVVTSNQQNIKNKVIHEIKKSNKVDKAHELSNTLPDAKAVDEIMGIEGNIRQAYYAAFDIILDDFNMRLWKSVMMRHSVIVL